ncbi:hypothetical protein FQN57_006400 [Myotisia sp. PD_48]|nr:hypothetical protein FQN57_006400 [Myotisia sp. PD_48]
MTQPCVHSNSNSSHQANTSQNTVNASHTPQLQSASLSTVMATSLDIIEGQSPDNSSKQELSAATITTQPQPGDSKKQQPSDKKEPVASANQEKISNAELKKRAKAEKAARRAQAKQEKDGGAEGASKNNIPSGPPATPKKGGASAGKQDSTTGKTQRPAAVPTAQISDSKKKKNQNVVDDKVVAVFGHLPWYTWKTGISGVNKDVHPAVLTLGMQIKDYVICGSSARCVATLLAFKRVVQSYSTPPGTSLTRHLTSYLSHQITFLTTCRPLAISQGNAIRALKLVISSIDPAVPEPEAKDEIYEFIENFIREKITFAGQVIANSAAQKVNDGDVIVCFSGSSVVQKVLLTAHSQGKKFRVSIIDTRPLFEGRHLARTLAKAGLKVQYSLINGISQAFKDATKVFLGAHAMTSNGGLFARVGTALVAMSAKEKSGGINIPVIVCCETVKFTDRVALDSIVVNEIAEADEIIGAEPTTQLTNLPSSSPPKLDTPKGASSKPAEDKKDIPVHLKNPKLPLENWREMPNLQLLNIMHDLTPAEYVDMVVTEMGSLPPSAVPIVHRISTDSQDSIG